MPRVNTVKAARKPRRCGRCGDTIQVGDGYRYWSFRYGGTIFRCMKSSCAPRQSELTQSKMAEVYSAQESFEEALDTLQGEEPGENSAVTEAMETFAQSVRDVADEYREADEQIGGGGYTESGERADALEAAADELESFNASVDMEDVEPCDEHGDDFEPEEGESADEVREACEACRDKRRDAWDELIEEARTHGSDVDWGV